ncbi:MAG: hypothetical protein JO341_02595 [Gammaproteobacteria bacterium]|nr:hypothetical protein [Gammaproteobacteria bacterium]MBV9619887.1 hypothetical protein [Gammaproteobacteria bacterium]
MRTRPDLFLPVLVSALACAGCVGGLATQRSNTPAPVTTPAISASALVGSYLELLQRLVAGAPAEQAEIVASAQRDYDFAPTPSHELKLALILGTPGHPATDRTRAQAQLRELMASPEVLLPAERALAFLELSQIDDHLTLEAENRRLQAEAVRADREHTASANHRLQTEVDENARLRKELDEARAKLAAIANIERSLNERKPGTTDR